MAAADSCTAQTGFRQSVPGFQSSYDSKSQLLMGVEIIKANLGDADHQLAIVEMMDAYSRDPMGDGKPLSDFAREHLVAGLTEHPTTLVFLVFENAIPCGIATFFRGFSTFAASLRTSWSCANCGSHAERFPKTAAIADEWQMTTQNP